MTVNKSEPRIRQMFAAISGRYDLLNHLLSAGVDYYWRWLVTRTVPPGDGPVLDLCTGTGDLALAYVRRARRTAGAQWTMSQFWDFADSAPASLAKPAGGNGRRPRIVGADFCHEMLVLGAKKARAAGADGQIRFVEADAQRLPFPDNSFAVVSVAFGLRNVTDTGRGLAEMARVCRPGGNVAVLEFSVPRWPPARAAYLFYLRRILPLVGQTLARNRQAAYNYLPASVLEFPDGEALAELMRGRGLTPVQWYPLSFGIATLYVGTKPRSA